MNNDKQVIENAFRQYRRKQIAELRPYDPKEAWDSKISISAEDLKNGSPKIGDMIARNPKNHKDQWLVAKQYFEDNFAALESSQEKDCTCGGYPDCICDITRNKTPQTICNSWYYLNGIKQCSLINTTGCRLVGGVKCGLYEPEPIKH